MGLLAVALLSGCQTKPPPDPNDPAQVGLVQPDVLLKNLKWASDAANERVAKGEIDEARAQELVTQTAVDLTRHITVERVDPGKAWEYAEVFRTARIWDKAKAAFEVALKSPKNEDRRVNDSLRLAQVLGKLGEVGEAIKRSRSVLDAKPEDRAPIMPALTLEIIPACRGKGHDAELAKLLEDAIPVFEGTVVNPKTDGGYAFVMTKPYHLKRARRLIMELRGGDGK